MKTFQELGIREDILQAITELGYENPMPVQEEVIPLLLGENIDIVALAQTGTGKTAAFGLPTIQNVDVQFKQPQALILAPTRELCLQITSDLQDYSQYVKGLKVLPVYGGSSIESQIKMLRLGVHIVVATPGRLIDLINRKTVRMEKVNTVVLDEADEMLNMGFTESINEILSHIPKERNMLLFSATMPKEIARISKNYMNNPREVTIGNRNESTNNVKHVAYIVHSKDKYNVLKRIVDFHPSIYAIVFCRTRKETQEIADHLMQDGYNADSLHGELSQAQRDLVMQKFRLKNLQVLVATDVAARGLDVSELSHVINYGLPDEVETYTHRSGRTGRAGKTGTSIAILHMKEKGRLREIERIINKQFTQGTIPKAEQICEKRLFAFADQLEKVKVNEEEIASFIQPIQRKLEWLSHEDLLKRCISLELNRLLDYYRNVADIQPATDQAREKREGSQTKQSRNAEPGFSRIYLNAGKMDGIYPNNLIELLNKTVGFRVEIGKIDLLTKFSYFEVPEKDASEVIEALNAEKHNGRKLFAEIAQPSAGQNSEGRGGFRKSDRSFSDKPGKRFDSDRSYGKKSSKESGSSDKDWRKKRK